jgi:uncharacterized protein with NRDE domain
MCTVTYLPLSSAGFVLTSNRDEATARKTSLPPAKYHIENHTIFYPKDTQANGTWIATSNNHFTLCLLNGAFQKHVSKPPYKRSRGLVLLDFFQYNDVNKYTSEYDFQNIEPFTLLIVKSEKKAEINELRWDGLRLHVEKKDASIPHIWSSANLYDYETILEREHWFGNWLGENNFVSEPETILSFHHFGGKGDLKNDMIIDRTKKRTVSITSIIQEEKSKTIVYEDLQNNQTKRFRIL